MRIWPQHRVPVGAGRANIDNMLVPAGSAVFAWGSGSAALQNQDTAHLPTSGHCVDHAAPIQEGLVLTKRKFVEPGRQETVSTVEGTLP